MTNLVFSDYRPGALADVIRMHMDYYATHWGFGIGFETTLAAQMAQFLDRYDDSRDLFVQALDANGVCIGSIAIDACSANDRGAHLRWFIVKHTLAGAGVGNALLQAAIKHCDDQGYQRCYLTTFAGLDAARSLYERHGFILEKESDDDRWGAGVREQLFARTIPLPLVR